jgi:tetratricopeptide (TPR) repeat protein
MPRLAIIVAVAVVLSYSGGAAAQSPRNDAARSNTILQIQQLIEARDLKKAEQLLTQAAKQFPQDPGLDNLRGIVAAQQGNYQAAQESFRHAVQRSPDFTNAYLNLGRLYQEHAAADPQALSHALDAYRRILRYESQNSEAHYQSAVIHLQLREYQQSLDHTGQLAPDVRRSAQTLSVICADYAALGNRKAADDAAAQLAANPDFSEADAKLALPALTAAKRDDLTLSLLSALQSRQALSPELQHDLGLAYEHSSKLAEARAALEKSVTKDTISASLLMELARVAHEQKDYRGALGYLAHARDLEPNNAKVHYYFGLVCVDLNLVAEARSSFEKAVHLEPENSAYNYAMGAASTYRQDPEEAVPYFQKYLKLNPQDSRGKLALANAFFRAKNYDSALPWLRAAAANPATAAAAHYYLGAIAVQEQRIDEARRELVEALKTNPDYPDALAELGQCFFLQKDYLKAEKQILKALQLEPDHFRANFYLLTLYTRTADPRREQQAQRFEQLQKLRDERAQEFLRIVQVRPFDSP